jgi:hypothetical protein
MSEEPVTLDKRLRADPEGQWRRACWLALQQVASAMRREAGKSRGSADLAINAGGIEGRREEAAAA